jgi:general bacterial porin, GBP family
MKRQLMGASIALVLAQAAHAQSSVTLFGTLDEGVVYANNQRTAGAGSAGHSNWMVDSGNISTSRWGLRGSEDLGGGLAAVFWLENGFNVSNGKFNNGGDLFGRQAYVGLTSNEYGSVTLGRQYDFMVDFVAPLSAVGSGFGGNYADHPYDNDNLANDLRLDNSVKFRSIDYAGFKFGAMYAFSGDPGEFSNNSAYSLGASYANGPVSVGAAYLEVNRSAGAANANATGASSTGDNDVLTTGGRQQIWGVGAKYMFGKSSVGALWTHSSTDAITGIAQGGSIVALNGNNMKFDNFELNGRYFVTPAFSLGASYTFTAGTFEVATSSVKPKWNQVMMQADYALSQQTDVYFETTYQHVSGGAGNPVFDASVFNLAASSSNEQVISTVGIRHRF